MTGSPCVSTRYWQGTLRLALCDMVTTPLKMVTYCSYSVWLLNIKLVLSPSLFTLLSLVFIKLSCKYILQVWFNRQRYYIYCITDDRDFLCFYLFLFVSLFLFVLLFCMTFLFSWHGAQHMYNCSSIITSSGRPFEFQSVRVVGIS